MMPLVGMRCPLLLFVGGGDGCEVMGDTLQQLKAGQRGCPLAKTFRGKDGFSAAERSAGFSPNEQLCLSLSVELPVTFFRGTLCYKIDSEHAVSFCQRQVIQESLKTSHCFQEPGLCAQSHRVELALITLGVNGRHFKDRDCIGQGAVPQCLT